MTMTITLSNPRTFGTTTNHRYPLTLPQFCFSPVDQLGFTDSLIAPLILYYVGVWLPLYVFSVCLRNFRWDGQLFTRLPHGVYILPLS